MKTDLLLVSLLQFHQMTLVLHIHSRHEFPLITQDLLNVQKIGFLLLQLALKLGISSLGSHNLNQVHEKSQSTQNYSKQNP